MSDEDESGEHERIRRKRRYDDRFITARFLLEIALAIIGCFLCWTIRDTGTALKDQAKELQRTEERVTAIEAKDVEREKALVEFKQGMDKEFTDVKSGMKEMNNKLDRLLIQRP